MQHSMDKETVPAFSLGAPTVTRNRVSAQWCKHLLTHTHPHPGKTAVCVLYRSTGWTSIVSELYAWAEYKKRSGVVIEIPQ